MYIHMYMYMYVHALHIPLPMCCQGHCVANLLALLELMSPRHYQVLRASFGAAFELEVGTYSHVCVHFHYLCPCCVRQQEFILHTFTAFCELVALDLYSNDWTILKLLGN